jgi:hypothetical protein
MEGFRYRFASHLLSPTARERGSEPTISVNWAPSGALLPQMPIAYSVYPAICDLAYISLSLIGEYDQTSCRAERSTYIWLRCPNRWLSKSCKLGHLLQIYSVIRRRIMHAQTVQASRSSLKQTRNYTKTMLGWRLCTTMLAFVDCFHNKLLSILRERKWEEKGRRISYIPIGYSLKTFQLPW